MKIIDLYVMVSKGEQPKKFKYRNEWWAYSVSDYDFRTLKQEYRGVDMPTYEYLMCIIDTSNLNDEVEIIEEDKEIEKITWEEKESMAGTPTENQQLEILKRRTEKLKKSFNELIDEVNKLKGKNE